ncbi:MAG: DUF5615 family PIN-like protein [Isosphaeraceae bacterium]
MVDEAIHGPDPFTPEEFASEYQVPLEAVLEALEYVAQNRPLIEQERDHEAGRLRARGARPAHARMRSLVDENLSSPRPASPLRAQGHDPVLASDVGLLSVTDARVLIFAIAQALPVLTRDSEDFEDLHDLVMAAVGHHPGILIVRFDNDPRHNLTDRGIATAISKLESSGVPIRDRIHVLNQWR